jgi:hypothetical protein
VTSALALALARGAAACVACALFAAPVAAQTAPPAVASERSVKAAYIYRFLSYVEWPAAVLPPGAALVIGVAAADDVAHELEQIARTRPGDERPIVVRRLGPADAWVGVHVLYAALEAAGRLPQVAKATQERSVLTIGDGERAVERGFVIGFVQIDSRLRFEVSTDAAERSGLKLSSRLLTVAVRISPGAR